MRMSFKHRVSISTLPPLVTPCFFSVTMGQTQVEEKKFYLPCLVSNNEEVPFVLFILPAKEKVSSLSVGPHGIAIYVCCNSQKVTVTI